LNKYAVAVFDLNNVSLHLEIVEALDELQAVLNSNILKWETISEYRSLEQLETDIFNSDMWLKVKKF